MNVSKKCQWHIRRVRSHHIYLMTVLSPLLPGKVLSRLLPGKVQIIARPYPSKAYQKGTIKNERNYTVKARVLAIAAGTL